MASFVFDNSAEEFEYLKGCTQNWPTTNYMVKVFSMYNYYPTNCDIEATEDEWNIRNLIWDFKANPHKPMDSISIVLHNEVAVDTMKEDIRRCLRYFFGNKVRNITLACIPASTKLVTERRYKYFSTEICKLTGMTNGYPYVKVIKDGEPIHTGGNSKSEYTIDSTFFRGKSVLMFDDVATKGRSMASFKYRLEQSGARVIGGFTIGRTLHHREQDPIESIL